MKRIFKYPVAINDYIEIEMPKGAQILDAQAQAEVPCIWALVDPSQPKETRRFRFAGTGHPIKETNLIHIGSFQMAGGALIFHMFEII